MEDKNIPTPIQKNNKSNNGTKNSKEKKKSFLDIYGTNLTNKARKNELDLVIGRDKEIEELKLQNLRLTVENEYIKKLNALVTERKKKESKK